MGDSIGKIIAIGLAGILMFIFPLMEVLQRQDDIVQGSVQAITERFVADVNNERVLTEDRLAKFQQEIDATGNRYVIALEHKVADENPGKKSQDVAKDKQGERVYYSKFTDQIEEVLDDEGKYNLKQGDFFSVSVLITNKTMAETLQSFIFGNNEANYKIIAQASGMVR